MEAVLNSRLKNVTSVADRVADFQRDAELGFGFFTGAKSSAAFTEVSEASEGLLAIYNEFLSDFLITQQYAQYNLTESDSLLINISPASFYTPEGKIRYIVNYRDTTGLRVEDPTLLAELKSMTQQEVDRISQLAFMSAFKNYDQQVKALKDYYPEIKNNYRRNIDIMIKNKEVEAAIEKIPTSAAYEAYSKERKFVNVVPASDSYSEIKEQVESALLGLSAFKQIYGENFFGNLDSVHIEIIDQLTII